MMNVPNTLERKQYLLDEIAAHEHRIKELRCILQGFTEAEELLMAGPKRLRTRTRKPRARKGDGAADAAQIEMLG
jgi:hypothetical protein